VARIRFIKEAQQIGFSLSEIGDLLALRADPAADCSEVRRQAVAKLEEVRRKIEQLQEMGAAHLDRCMPRPRRTASLLDHGRADARLSKPVTKEAVTRLDRLARSTRDPSRNRQISAFLALFVTVSTRSR